MHYRTIQTAQSSSSSHRTPPLPYRIISQRPISSDYNGARVPASSGSRFPGGSLRNFSSSTGSYRWPRIGEASRGPELGKMDLRRIMADEPAADGPSANYHNDPFYDTDYTPEYASQSEKVPHAMILKPARFDPEESASIGQTRRPSLTAPSTPKAEYSELQFSDRANSEPFDDGTLDPPRPSVKFYRNTSVQQSVSTHSRTCTPPERNDTPEPAPTQDWMECVERHGENKFTCHWDVCGYTAGRQLVKRHVESVHLHLRPHTCHYCPASFPQKANLAVHISCQHEKTRPFKCNDPKVVGGDPTCTRDFNDRAALHRHKIAAHGYVPKATKRSEKFGKKGSAMHESLPPWAADE